MTENNPKTHTSVPERIIYMVNARIPNERAHGIQIVNTCEALGKHGADVTLVTSKFPGVRPSLALQYGVQETFTHRRIAAIDIPGLPFRYVVRNATFFIRSAVYLLHAWLVSLFTHERFVVYVRGEVMLFLIPLTYVMPMFFETHQIRNYAWFYRIALRRVKGIVVVTQNLKNKFVEEYKLPAEKILVARDAVDLTSFQVPQSSRAVWSTFGIPETKKIVLYAGTLAPEKGVDTLADASLCVSSDTHIVFLGGTEAQVLNFTKRYGDRKNISIVGRVEHTEVPKYMAAADVLVLPDRADFMYSNLYTSPMKLFEYMATGKPIVAARVPSLLEVLSEDTAVFFDPGDATQLGKCLETVLGSMDVYSEMGRRATQVVTAFTWEKRAIAILGHIRNCLSRS